MFTMVSCPLESTNLRSNESRVHGETETVFSGGVVSLCQSMKTRLEALHCIDVSLDGFKFGSENPKKKLY